MEIQDQRDEEDFFVGKDKERALPPWELLAKVRGREVEEKGGRKLSVGTGGECLGELLVDFLIGKKFLAF